MDFPVDERKRIDQIYGKYALINESLCFVTNFSCDFDDEIAVFFQKRKNTSWGDKANLLPKRMLPKNRQLNGPFHGKTKKKLCAFVKNNSECNGPIWYALARNNEPYFSINNQVFFLISAPVHFSIWPSSKLW